MPRAAYPSDLSDAEWHRIAPLVPEALPGGRPRISDMREICNAIFYVLRTGCPWRFLPHDLPPWITVYYYFRRWQADGTWKQMNDTLRRQVRQTEGRESDPSAAIIDSQSVKTTEKGGRGATTRGRRSRVGRGTSS